MGLRTLRASNAPPPSPPPAACRCLNTAGGDGRGQEGGRTSDAVSARPLGSIPGGKLALPGASPDGSPPALLATQALPLSPPLQKSHVPPLPQRGEEAESAKFFLLTLLSLACIAGVLAASGVVYCLRHRAHHRLKEKLSALGADAGSDATAAYQVSSSLSPLPPPPPPPRTPLSVGLVLFSTPAPPPPLSPMNIPTDSPDRLLTAGD